MTQKNNAPQGRTSKRPQRAKHQGPGAQMMPGEKPKDLKGTLHTLLQYLNAYKFRLIVVFVFAIAGTVFNVIAPTVLGDATDIIASGLMKGTGIDFTKLLHYMFFLIGLYGISWLFNFCQGFIMARVSQLVTYRMRKQMSEKIDRLPLKYFDMTTHGEVQSRFINDIETINQSLSQSITQTIASIATIIGILVMMIRISLVMTIVALCVLPLSFGIIKLVVGRSQGHFKTQQNSLGEVNGHVEEMYNGHTIIKAFNREEESIEKFDEINEKLRASAWKSQFLSGIMMPATQFIGNLGYVAICILGGYLAIHGRISIGNIQSFIQYVRQFNQPLQQVANVANLIQSTCAAAERIFNFIDEDEEADAFGSDTADKITVDIPDLSDEAALAAANASGRGSVEFRNITFRYKHDEPVINDFSYKASPGSRVAIVGPTGAGKTTIVKLLLRYYELDSGSIFVDGHDIRDYSRKDLRGMFGMVLQDSWLFSGTIRDNIRYGKMGASDEEIQAAAKAAHIDHFIRTQPRGYDMEINEEASNISQGQKQLLTIARAMLADNPILILDEATSSVDTRTERLIQSAMTQLMKGRTSFVIAHRLSTIKDADHILVMDHGDIVEQGTHDELLARDGFYAGLYNSQFAGQ